MTENIGIGLFVTEKWRGKEGETYFTLLGENVVEDDRVRETYDE